MVMPLLTSMLPPAFLNQRYVWLIQMTNRYGQPLLQFDPVEERRLVYKIDLYIIPTVALLYLFCFIDRANIGKPILSRASGFL